MSIDEIVNKAIPLTFEGVKCAALENKLRQMALRRRIVLKEQILTLLETNQHAGVNNQVGVGSEPLSY